MYLLTYLYVCWHVDFRRLRKAIGRHPWLSLLTTAGALCAYFTILYQTFASFEWPLMRML